MICYCSQMQPSVKNNTLGWEVNLLLHNRRNFTSWQQQQAHACSLNRNKNTHEKVGTQYLHYREIHAKCTSCKNCGTLTSSDIRLQHSTHTYMNQQECASARFKRVVVLPTERMTGCSHIDARGSERAAASTQKKLERA